MKRIKNIGIVTLLVFTLSCGQGTDIEQDKKDITTALMQSAVDWNKGDMEAYMGVYWQSEKLQFIGASGITYGWQQTLDNYKKRYPTPDHTGKLTFEILNLEPIAEKVYTLTGKFYLERNVGNTDGIFTLIFKQINNKWVIISDHTQ